MTRDVVAQGRLGVLGLGVWLAATGAWWSLALWPMAPETAQVLLRARAVCFNTGPSGLPTSSGWLLLIGQPVGMLAVMMVIWGDSVRAGIAALRASRAGRTVLLTTVALLLGGIAAAAVRVSLALPGTVALVDEPPPQTYPRLGRPLPDFELVDQTGASVTPASATGRVTLLTFAFGHCETVCPAVVHQAGEVTRILAERHAERAPQVWVLTLDPWRDTPARLPSLATQWMLPAGSRALSGPAPEVERLLDALGVARRRDLDSGDILHPALVFLIDENGSLAYASTGGLRQVLGLAERLLSVPT